ncbi:MAG: hypothetical protein E7370_04180 [Clostridiales bacterium]|nr:hypothetical protein [Clostridiales bacterium]
MKTQTKKQTKTFSLVTYCIALLSMLLGLFLPFFGGKMLALQLLDVAKGNFVIGDGSWANVKTILRWDLPELAILAFVAIVLVGVLALIIAFLTKKESKFTKVAAYLVEIGALCVLAVIIVFILLSGVGIKALIKEYLAVLVPFAVLALIGVIQVIVNKKGSGIVKLIMFGLSVVACLMLVGIPVASIEGKLDFLPGELIFIGEYANGYSVVLDLWANKASIMAWLGSGMTMVMNICIVLAVVLTLINAALDLLAVITGTNKFCKIVNVIRYALALVAVAGAIVLAKFVVKVAVGTYVLLLAAIIVIQLIIAIVRLLAHKKAKVAVANNQVDEQPTYYDPYGAAVQPAAPAYDNSFAEPYNAPRYCAGYTQPVAPAAPAQAQQTQVQQQVVYTVAPIYHGPSDSFMNTLTVEEKIEFSQIFIEKKNGSFANVPDYVINGDNSAFFSAIFIYLGKFRGMLSDGLMSKMYAQLA